MNPSYTAAKPSRGAFSPAQVLDAYFLETRAKLLEIAANLDRIERAGASGASSIDFETEPRLAFIRQALTILQAPVTSGGPASRAEQILRLYSKD